MAGKVFTFKYKGKPIRKVRLPPKERKALPVRASKGLKSTIAKIVNSKIETKYVAQDIVGGALVTSGGPTPGILQGMLLPFPERGRDYQEGRRRGSRPVRASSRFVVHFEFVKYQF